MDKPQRKTWDILLKGKVWKTAVIADPSDPEQSTLTLPEDLLALAGWEEGDSLMCSVLPDNRIILSKI